MVPRCSPSPSQPAALIHRPFADWRLCKLPSLGSGKVYSHRQAVCSCSLTHHPAHLPLSKDIIANPTKIHKCCRTLLLRSRISFMAPNRTVSAIVRGLGRLRRHSVPTLPRMIGAGWLCPSPCHSQILLVLCLSEPLCPLGHV